ncbi:MAG: universal stress protein [Desulfobacula sp.]|nr:universal stress protein [Desulfobacula sp.]
MFKIILYPTDFSDNAGKSLDYLKQLHKAGTEKIILLNVIHQRILDTLETIHKAAYFQDGRYHEDRDESELRLEKDRKNKIAPIAGELEAAGLEVKIRIEKGYPVKEILRVEKEEAVSAIVMGSHGRNNLLGARIGSVSEKIVRRSITPVLLVKR